MAKCAKITVISLMLALWSVLMFVFDGFDLRGGSDEVIRDLRRVIALHHGNCDDYYCPCKNSSSGGFLWRVQSGKFSRMPLCSFRVSEKLNPWSRYWNPISLEIDRFVRTNAKYISRSDGKPLYLHQNVGDADPWADARIQPDAPATRILLEIVEKHQNLFWLHWNPSVMNLSTGHVATRMVPIPDEEVVTPMKGRVKSPPCLERVQRVAWRGATTGIGRPTYSFSDRYRTVDAFAHNPNADVKFDRINQGVSIGNQSSLMKGSRMSKSQFSRFAVLLDVDGNVNAWEGLRWKLFAGAVVVKVDPHNFVQWYYPQLKHGTHLYLTNVEEVVPSALTVLNNPVDRCESVSAAAADFARRFLTKDSSFDALHEALLNLDRYRTPQDWRVRR